MFRSWGCEQLGAKEGIAKLENLPPLPSNENYLLHKRGDFSACKDNFNHYKSNTTQGITTLFLSFGHKGRWKRLRVCRSSESLVCNDIEIMRLEASLNCCLDPSGRFYISTTQEISENIRRIGMTDPTDSEDESPGEHPDVPRYNPVERAIVAVLLSKLRLSHHLLLEKGYGNDTVKHFWNSLLAFCSYGLDDVNVLTSTAVNQTQVLHTGIGVIDYETGEEMIITGIPDCILYCGDRTDNIVLVGEGKSLRDEKNNEQCTLLHSHQDSMAHSTEHAHKLQYMNKVLAILYKH